MSHEDVVRRAFSAQAASFGPGSHFAAGDAADWIDAAARLGPDDLVLDAGGGAGDLSRALAPRARQFVVADLTPAMLDRGRGLADEAGSGTVLFLRAALEELPFAGGSFDAVLCRLVLHHLAAPGAALGELARVARPGGRAVIVDTVAAEGALGERMNALERLRDPSHTRALSEAELVSAVQAAGFAVSEVTEQERRLPFEDWLMRGRPSPEDERAVRDAVAAELAGGPETGLLPVAVSGEITIAHRWVRLLAVPAEAALAQSPPIA